MDNHSNDECYELEKEYCRVSSSTDQKKVRSYEILIQAYSYVKTKYLSEAKSYPYIKEQLMAIRQEIVIQNIQNEFAIKVYEYSARIAIENRDLVIFNQCQTALIHLYKINKDFLSDSDQNSNQLEFFRYRLLYFAFYDQREINSILTEAQYKLYKSKCVDIFELMKYLNEKNYFKVYIAKDAFNNIEQLLIEPFLLRLKTLSLIHIAYAYYTEVSISFIASCLCFDCTDSCLLFLEELNVVLTPNKDKMKCKESISMLRQSQYLNTIIN